MIYNQILFIEFDNLFVSKLCELEWQWEDERGGGGEAWKVSSDSEEMDR